MGQYNKRMRLLTVGILLGLLVGVSLGTPTWGKGGGRGRKKSWGGGHRKSWGGGHRKSWGQGGGHGGGGHAIVRGVGGGNLWGGLAAAAAPIISAAAPAIIGAGAKLIGGLLGGLANSNNHKCKTGGHCSPPPPGCSMCGFRSLNFGLKKPGDDVKADQGSPEDLQVEVEILEDVE